ncbi:MAG: DUF4838 domain-containing protein, partial [Clostridia bacterium]|nr:DUF4838 domain-containing protein [Clostridia bacterium]
MKILKRLVAFTLCAVSCMSVYGCSEQKGAQKGEQSEQEELALLRNDYSRYVLLLPDEASEKETFAAQEFVYFMELATDYTFETVAESELRDGQKYLSIGHTEKLSESGIVYDNDKLGRSGYKIVTQDENVYLFGSSVSDDCGTVYAVYKLLEDTINYKYFGELAIRYDHTDQIYMKKYDLTDIPSFDTRYMPSYTAGADKTHALRMRMTPRDQKSVKVGGHTANIIVPLEKYYDEHPDWWSENKEQPCMSNEGYIAQFIENLIAIVESEPMASEYDLTLPDNYSQCECETCAAITKKYGAYTAVYNMFLNRVTAAVDEWVEKNQPGRRRITYYAFSYLQTEVPPVQKAENGEYKLIDDKVILRDNICMKLAYIFMVRNKAVDDEVNQNVYEYMKGWSLLTDNLMWYNYSVNWHENGYMYAINDFDVTERTFRIAKKYGVVDAYWTFGYEVTNQSCLFNLKEYCSMQLVWNIDLHYEDLAMEYFDFVFGKAAPMMKEYYNVYRTQMTWYENTVRTDAGAGESVYSAETFPKKFVDKLYDLIQQA